MCCEMGLGDMRRIAHASSTGTTPRRASFGLIVLVGATVACGGQGTPPRGAARPATAQPIVSTTTGNADEANRRIMAASSLDATTPDDSSIRDEYRVGPGDRLRVDVFGAERFSGSFTVDDAGAIALPLVGPIATAGLTPAEVEEALEARLRETYMRDPHVTLQVEEMRSRGVSILGAVRRPGVYQVTGRSTLLDVLAQAEGLTETAGSTVMIRRGRPTSVDSAAANSAAAVPVEGEMLEVDLGRLLWSGNPEGNVRIHPGDVVQVRSAALVYVVGEVNRPGGFTVPMGESMTVLQALAMAEGLGGTAAASRSVIVREHFDGSREQVPVDLDDVLDGKAAPPTLRPNDVLFVPNNGTKSIAIGVVNTLVRMVTLRGLVY